MEELILQRHKKNGWVGGFQGGGAHQAGQHKFQGLMLSKATLVQQFLLLSILTFNAATQLFFLHVAFCFYIHLHTAAMVQTFYGPETTHKRIRGDIQHTAAHGGQYEHYPWRRVIIIFRVSSAVFR